jgi:hypothetical protein
MGFPILVDMMSQTLLFFPILKKSAMERGVAHNGRQPGHQKRNCKAAHRHLRVTRPGRSETASNDSHWGSVAQ